MPKRSPTTPPAARSEAATPAPAAPTKLATLTGLLRRPEGATLTDLTTATGWQAHSVRGAIAGALKKKAGLAITSEKIEGERRYRIAEDAA